MLYKYRPFTRSTWLSLLTELEGRRLQCSALDVQLSLTLEDKGWIITDKLVNKLNLTVSIFDLIINHCWWEQVSQSDSVYVKTPMFDHCLISIHINFKNSKTFNFIQM